MDLGLSGKSAIVCGGSRGMGRAAAEMLAAEGVALTLLARNVERLERAAEEIRGRFGVAVTAVAGDVTSEAGRQALIAACPDPDILITNADGMPPGDFRDPNRPNRRILPVHLSKEPHVVQWGLLWSGFLCLRQPLRSSWA